jgi:hypothetical protein
MKKSFLILAVAGLAMASCKKNYTCTCTDTDTTNPGAPYVMKGKAKKSDAKNTCDNLQTTYTIIGYNCVLTY